MRNRKRWQVARAETVGIEMLRNLSRRALGTKKIASDASSRPSSREMVAALTYCSCTVEDKWSKIEIHQLRG